MVKPVRLPSEKRLLGFFMPLLAESDFRPWEHETVRFFS